jgi:lauroyl/myristoyl acyltransferase
MAHGDSRADIRPALPANREGRLRADLARVTQDLAHRFEDLIRVEPTHWHLLQPNWPSDRPAQQGSDPADRGARVG